MRTTEPKLVAYIPGDAFVEGRGWRVSIVIDGEDGHRPTGNWPYEGKPGQTQPWFWGPTYQDACKEAGRYNEKLGISADEVFKIVARSMGHGISRGNRR